MSDQGWAGLTAGHSCGAVEVGYLTCRGHRRDGREAAFDAAELRVKHIDEAAAAISHALWTPCSRRWARPACRKAAPAALAPRSTSG